MYYKVVLPDRWGLRSSVVHGTATARYGVNTWATAPEWLAEKGYHLLVFDNYDSALDFASEEEIIYTCEVEGVIEDLPPVCNPFILGDYSSDLTVLEKDEYNDWPKGTVMAKKVMLKEEAYFDKE